MNAPAYLSRQYQFHSALTAFFCRRETQKGVLDVVHPSGIEVFFSLVDPYKTFIPDEVKSTLATKSPNLVVMWRESGDLVARQAMRFGNLLQEMKLASRLFDENIDLKNAVEVRGLHKSCVFMKFRRISRSRPL